MIKRLSERCSDLFVVGLVLSFAPMTEARRGSDFPIEFQGGSLVVESIQTRYETINPDATKSRVAKSDGQSLWLDFGFNAAGFAGEFTTNIIAGDLDSDFKYRYGDRIFDEGGDRAEIYNFSATRLGDDYDLNLFYHIPRYHWGEEGDFFGLMYETTNMYDQDIWNEKAPYGVEFIGKDRLDGLKVVAGHEIYWGADPMALIKYQFGENKQYSAIVESDISKDHERKRLSLQGAYSLNDSTVLKAGVLRSGSELADNEYQVESDGVRSTRILSNSDALAYRLRLEKDVGTSSLIYGEYNHAGLVATRGEHQEIWETNIPYSQAGNKKTSEVGGRFISGNWMVSPRLFYRYNAVSALSVAARNANSFRDQNSDFAVHDNREARAAEVFLTFDPTPGTFFYEWDNYLKEDAPFAFNVGLTRVEYPKRTDVREWDWGRDWGRSAENIEKIFSRFVINPTNDLKITGELEAGHQQPLFGGDVDPSDPTNTISNITRFTSLDMKFVYKQKNVISMVYKEDAYGEYDWYANYGTSYPEQLMLGYERLLDDRSRPSKLGVTAYKRSMDANSGGDWQSGANRDMSEIQLYYSYSF